MNGAECLLELGELKVTNLQLRISKGRRAGSAGNALHRSWYLLMIPLHVCSSCLLMVQKFQLFLGTFRIARCASPSNFSSSFQAIKIIFKINIEMQSVRQYLLSRFCFPPLLQLESLIETCVWRILWRILSILKYRTSHKFPAHPVLSVIGLGGFQIKQFSNHLNHFTNLPSCFVEFALKTR